MTLILNGTDNSATVPAVTGSTAGTSTGEYFPTTNQWAVSTNGTQAILVDASQNVGLGVTPSAKLDVNGVVCALGGNSPTGGFNLRTVAGTITPRITNDASNATVIRAGASGASVSFNNFANSAELAAIDSSGVLFFNSGYGSSAKAYGCRAWCQYNNSQAIVGSANISSITVNGTGDIRLNFTTAMPDANFSAVASTNEDGGTAKFCNPTQPSTTTIRVVTYNIVGATTNNTYNFVAVFR